MIKAGHEWMESRLRFIVFNCFSRRDPLGPRGSPGPESDILSNLLGGATSPVENPVRWSCNLSAKQEYNESITFFMLDIFQIQPCPVAFSRFGCEAYIGDRVQGEQKPYLAISVCSGPFQPDAKACL